MDPADMVPTSLVGTKAQSLLVVPGFSGKVLAVVSKATYLSENGGEILWVAREGLPAHRRSILASFYPGSVCTGMSFSTSDHRLRIGEEVALDLSQAVVWDPSTINARQVSPLAIVNRCFREVLVAVQSFDSGKGLGQAIPLIAAVARGSDITVPCAPASWVGRALAPIAGLVRACLSRNMVAVTERGRELIGLGPGLTPSGDDFLGGLLFVAHHLKAVYPSEFRWEEQPITALLDRAHAETNRISYTILSDLALGHGPEPLHHLVLCVLEDQEPDRMPHVARLVKIGHTSGWDLLAGALAGMLLTAGSPERG